MGIYLAFFTDVYTTVLDCFILLLVRTCVVKYQVVIYVQYASSEITAAIYPVSHLPSKNALCSILV